MMMLRPAKPHSRIGMKALATLVLAMAFTACSEQVPDMAFAIQDPDSRGNRGNDSLTAPPSRANCDQHNPLRNAYFGDLHVHTALSNDALSFGTGTTPDDAYRFGFGQGSVKLRTYQDSAENLRELRIDRPLDFIAVTDHAEFLGEQTLCADPTSGVADAEFCQAFQEGEGRNPGLLVKIFSPFPRRDSTVCGKGGERCAAALAIPWQQTIDAAQQWNDSSANCERTTFIGFEYSSMRMGSNLHRNVIFRNDIVPRRPVSYLDTTREWRLWELLDQQCLRSGTGCDALAIPHNSNISNGRMFATDYPGATSLKQRKTRAQLRSRLEPVVEIMQHKGDSECRNGLTGVLGGEDELCEFEKFENVALRAVTGEQEAKACYDGPLADWMPHKGPDCLARTSYVRYALIEGLKERARIGINPFKLGIVASTDTHNGTPGAVSEANFEGHLGWGDGTASQRVSTSSGTPGNASNNPGGLIGVWSQENARDAIFDSIRRKEVFGTSGPRIQPRLFGGWRFESSLCRDPQLLSKAYAQGVPMGSDLPDGDGAPTFLATAVADPGTAGNPGTGLQRLQIIKGWYDENGDHHQAVYDIAVDANNGASVDLETCATEGQGFAQLCGVWQDPQFDPDQSAVYYLRAVENPSCRYSTRQCNALSMEERPESCGDNSVPKTLQERAWTSSIWYTARSLKQ